MMLPTRHHERILLRRAVAVHIRVRGRHDAAKAQPQVIERVITCVAGRRGNACLAVGHDVELGVGLPVLHHEQASGAVVVRHGLLAGRHVLAATGAANRCSYREKNRSHLSTVTRCAA